MSSLPAESASAGGYEVNVGFWSRSTLLAPFLGEPAYLCSCLSGAMVGLIGLTLFLEMILTGSRNLVCRTAQAGISAQHSGL